MKEETVKFKCDTCGAESVGIVFPYDRGWIYLYKLNFKASPKLILEYTDRHFCSVTCMQVFTNLKIAERANKAEEGKKDVC